LEIPNFKDLHGSRSNMQYILIKASQCLSRALNLQLKFSSHFLWDADCHDWGGRGPAGVQRLHQDIRASNERAVAAKGENFNPPHNLYSKPTTSFL
jgi:hypothetical protein